jgi:hypothetical protein
MENILDTLHEYFVLLNLINQGYKLTTGNYEIIRDDMVKSIKEMRIKFNLFTLERNNDELKKIYTDICFNGNINLSHWKLITDTLDPNADTDDIIYKINLITDNICNDMAEVVNEDFYMAKMALQSS